MLCSNCGKEVSDEANFCEKCGFKLKSEENIEQVKVEAQETIEVELVEKEEEKKPCDWCKSANLDLVSDEGKPKLFRCPACGHYFGNFMRKGFDIYYDTTHLRIGQYIAHQLVNGKYRVSAHKDHRDKGIEDLAEKIQLDVKLDRKKITDALSYLIESNVLYTYYEPTPDGEFEWFGVDFSENMGGDSQVTK
jgi:DNA-directed RNA polymerase subunit RPC12/RpoP